MTKELPRKTHDLLNCGFKLFVEGINANNNANNTQKNTYFLFLCLSLNQKCPKTSAVFVLNWNRLRSRQLANKISQKLNVHSVEPGFGLFMGHILKILFFFRPLYFSMLSSTF